MPATTIVSSGGALRLYDDSVQTFDRLPVATYTIRFSKMTGYSLHETNPLSPGEEAVYGGHATRVGRIATGYAAMDRSLGVILSGDKGMGKSLMIRMLAEKMREEHELPTVLVQHSTPGLASFLDELGECLVVFDEFEKVFAPGDDDEAPQNQFLSLFDGLSTTKRLYVLSVNSLDRTSDYMLNRPGRFHYHMRFAYPGPETVAEYLRDQVPGITEAEVSAVVEFSRKIDLNFDHLRAIAFELGLGEDFAAIIGDLNIKRTSRRGHDPVHAVISWPDGDTDEIDGELDLFAPDALQSIESWHLDLELRLRMRDALPTPDGYALPAGAFELIDTRTNKERVEAGEDDKEPDLSGASVLLQRPPKHSIDF
ncbi:AAA family ATPase [Nocardiopsis sp. JB363]|uniref:AAA family ATPase n=1 Tax=Nocardiopsis sp. JB363 TaxID=1434837 RepID=UPI00097AC114|nr:AAA family ATPase [Nocardiopsis sp. JB363]SIO86975.1 Phage protein [Nocardiopsis sp. JB363]